MALLTASDLLSSREAQEAGLSVVSEAEATAAIAEATAELHALLGHKVEDTTTSYTFRGPGSHILYLPQRARAITAITEDGIATDAIVYHLANSGWLLTRESGSWSAESIAVTGTFGFTDTDEEWVLARKAVRILAVNYLRSTSSTSNFPAGAGGAMLTGYSSESASFSFFTPTAEHSGHPDVDRLISMIHASSGWPFKSSKVVTSVPLQGRSGDQRVYLEG